MKPAARFRVAPPKGRTLFESVVGRAFTPLLALAFALVVAGCASTPVDKSTIPGPFPKDDPAVNRIAGAQADAGRSGRRVLLVFGANWCSDSRKMVRRLTEDARVAPLVRDGYVLTLVDVGLRDGPQWNSDVVERYGRPFEGRGIPALVVLDAEGTQLTTQANNPLKDSDHRRPKRLIAFLREWTPR